MMVHRPLSFQINVVRTPARAEGILVNVGFRTGVASISLWFSSKSLAPVLCGVYPALLLLKPFNQSPFFGVGVMFAAGLCTSFKQLTARNYGSSVYQTIANYSAKTRLADGPRL